jgi:hypothetical protein
MFAISEVLGAITGGTKILLVTVTEKSFPKKKKLLEFPESGCCLIYVIILYMHITA